ncbi:MAG: precorrin-4 C(11)-methyltransferase [Firmicutes bacterium]|nr:precorrin-4 C(11)-methyltransferase [Bacillota bacterium]
MQGGIRELKAKVYFIGAGPGDPDLLTIKAKNILEAADVVIYAGSLVNPEILRYARKDAKVYNSAGMTLEEIVRVMAEAVRERKVVARLHTGDPSLYGAIQEQIDWLEEDGILCEVVPGVSSMSAAAASLKREYTLPGVSQTMIVTRLSGRTSVPGEERLSYLAKHGSSMVIFLSVHMIREVLEQLRAGYSPETPVAVVYKASWPDEQIIRGRLKDIAEKVEAAGVGRTALILVGDFLECKHDKYERSKLYDGDFEHTFRGRV